MPLTRLAADTLGVVTICLVALLTVQGLLCIVYSIYFRSRVNRHGFVQLRFFSGPWIIRIIFILFSIWWGFGEIIRLSWLKREGRPLSGINLGLQESVCKWYIVSNLGFAEPCLFLTLVFLLRAPLQEIQSGILSQKWNTKTAVYVLFFCLPVFVLQVFVILAGPRLNNSRGSLRELPRYFTETASHNAGTALCKYPLSSTILLGFFSTVLTAYLFWLGSRILKLVINKCLQKRVYTLIISVSTFLPLRVLLLGLSVLTKPEHILFEVLTFLAFLALLCCAMLCISLLVYCPVVDSLAIGNLQDADPDVINLDDTIALIGNQNNLDEILCVSPSRDSDGSAKQRGSISFRAPAKDGTSTEAFVELSLFSPSRDGISRQPNIGWPMYPKSTQESG